MIMILSVYDHEKTANIEVPVTPNSTFVDVLRCCKGLSDGKYYITGIFSNREERIVELYERPYEFLRRNGNFRRQFVIYKTGNENIFFKGANGHQDKKRFTLTDLANFVSYHEKVVEQHNKTIHKMEERLKKLRNEEMIRKIGETNLLTLMQRAEVQERRIDLIRKQKGHPLPQRLRKAQGTTLEELKVLFRTTDGEVKRLKQRIEGSMVRINNYRQPSNNSEKSLLQGLKSQSDFGSSIVSAESKKEKASYDLDLKIKDLRNRLNLDRKSITSSLRTAGVSRTSQELGSRSSGDIRPISAIEMLKSANSSSSKAFSASSSSSNDVLPFENVSSSTDVIRRRAINDSSAGQTSDVLDSGISTTRRDICDSTSSSVDAISCQPINNDKSCLNTSSRPDPSNSSSHEEARIQDSSEQMNFVRFRGFPPIAPTPASALPHKRRQRAAVRVGLDSLPSTVDNIQKTSSAIIAAPLVINKPAAPFVKPTTAKTYFYKVFQRAKDDLGKGDDFSASEHDRSFMDEVSEALGSAGKIENIGKNQLEGALKCTSDVSREQRRTNVSADVIGEIVGDLTSEHPSIHQPDNRAFNNNPLDILSDSSVEDLQIHLPQISTSGLQKEIPNGERANGTPTLTINENLSPSRTPNSFSIFPSSPIVQVTPMSTTSDNPESESDIFNITGNQSDIGFCANESSAFPSISSSLSSQIKSTGDVSIESCHDLEHRNEIKDDSFFSIPVSSALSIPDTKEVDSCRGTETGDLSPKDATVAAPSYPFIEVLEQLDGSSSIFRHSAGGIRSLRKRLSSDDFHHHGVPSEFPLFDSIPCNSEEPCNRLSAVHSESTGKDVPSGLQDDFKPKCLPQRYFTDFSFGATTSVDINHVPLNERLSRDLKEKESIQSFESLSGSLVGNRCSRSTLPDIICTEGSVMECISFKDNLGNENEIIIISPKENVDEPDEKEPGIIVAGGKADVSEEEDDKTCSDDNDDETSTSDAQDDEEEGEEDDDKNDSFSPLIDNFCEGIQNKPDDISDVPIPDKIVAPFGDKGQDRTHGIKSVVPSLVLDLEAPTFIKGILKKIGSSKPKKESSRVVFNPLAILLDAALQGELDVVEDIIKKHGHVNMVNDEGISALHNAICAGHSDIAQFLVTSGGDVNAADSDLWTPLHCAASCYNISLIQLLVESGACVFATTESEGETALDKCEDEEEDGGSCKKYLEEIQAKMMRVGAELYAAYDSQSSGSSDELHFSEGDIIVICNPGKQIESLKGGRNDEEDEEEDDYYVGEGWCFARNKRTDEEGYAPKNYLSMFPRVTTHS